jgi:hypothetical protein
VCKWSGEVIHMWQHLCFRRGDNSTTNRVLKTTRFPRFHFKPMTFLEICKKWDIYKYIVILDIDECQGTSACSQLCQNTIGSYTCSCRPEYNLHSDGKSCIGKYVLTSSFAKTFFLQNCPFNGIIRILFSVNWFLVLHFFHWNGTPL